MQQVKNLLASQIIADDWKRRGTNGVMIHGWVYHLETVSRSTPVSCELMIGQNPRPECLCGSSWPHCGPENHQRGRLLGFGPWNTRSPLGGYHWFKVYKNLCIVWRIAPMHSLYRYTNPVVALATANRHWNLRTLVE